MSIDAYIEIKQQELLQSLKNRFSDIEKQHPSIIDTFFYALQPLEKQIVMELDFLHSLFGFYLSNREKTIEKNEIHKEKIYSNKKHTFIFVLAKSFLRKPLNDFLNLNHDTFKTYNFVYNILETAEGILFCCAFFNTKDPHISSFFRQIRHALFLYQQKLKEKQILKIAIENPIISLNPHIDEESVSSDILRLVFEGLIRIGNDGKTENALAESYEISDDETEYIFKLRPTFWNNGEELTAHHFVHSWKKILSPRFKTSYSELFYPIKYAKEANKGRVSIDEVGIEALDNFTLRIKLSNPTPSFLRLISHSAFFPIHPSIDRGPKYYKNYPSNGPFQLKVTKQEDSYQLIKNPFYWDAENVTLNEIVLKSMNPAKALQAFQKKEIDWIGNPFIDWQANFSSYKLSKEDQLVSFPNNLLYGFICNTTYLPLQHCKFRQALAHAIQRDQIINHAPISLKAAYSLHLPHSQRNHHIIFPEFNIEKAKHLYHDALRQLELNLKSISCLNLLFVKNDIHEYTAVCLKKQLKENLELECELKAVTRSEFYQRLTEGDFHLGLLHRSDWLDDPVYTLNSFKTFNQKSNFSKWENSDYQHFLNLSENEKNFGRRLFYLNKAEQVLYDEMPFIPLYYQPHQALIKKDIEIKYCLPGGPFNLAQSFKTPIYT